MIQQVTVAALAVGTVVLGVHTARQAAKKGTKGADTTAARPSKFKTAAQAHAQKEETLVKKKDTLVAKNEGLAAEIERLKAELAAARAADAAAATTRREALAQAEASKKSLEEKLAVTEAELAKAREEARRIRATPVQAVSGSTSKPAPAAAVPAAPAPTTAPVVPAKSGGMFGRGKKEAKQHKENKGQK